MPMTSPITGALRDEWLGQPLFERIQKMQEHAAQWSGPTTTRDISVAASDFMRAQKFNLVV
ncbi:hypothetical protein AOR01nite_21840 [Acetobacter orleanensis]|uniref:Uncharacterized protein n=1 Tax=Acetobacter orleanensis TaxID=104099 RepID=A0A4Y3TRJ9_9PROT|nr:hypothetical protein Abol_047_008 [Acetobacter orleanensis JCM 7639]GEB83707.1 hypothetical protein AOR01nite_21840 [Acetobacter orleanensis]